MILMVDKNGVMWVFAQQGAGSGTIDGWYSTIGDQDTWTAAPSVGITPNQHDFATNESGSLVFFYGSGSTWYNKTLDVDSIGSGFGGAVQVNKTSLYVGVLCIHVEAGPTDEFDYWFGGQAGYVDPYRIYHQRSTDGGATFIGSDDIVYALPSGSPAPQMSAVRKADHTLYVAFKASVEAFIRIYKGTSGGAFAEVQGYGSSNEIIAAIYDGTEKKTMTRWTMGITEDGQTVLCGCFDQVATDPFPFYMTEDNAGKIGMAKPLPADFLQDQAPYVIQAPMVRWHFNLEKALESGKFPELAMMVPRPDVANADFAAYYFEGHA